MPTNPFIPAALLLLALLLSPGAAAQPSFEVTGATSTQAILAIRGADAPCTLALREGSPEGPLHPDVSGVSDLSRPDTITWSDGTRLVTLGHQRADLALAADTTWHLSVSGCVSPAQSLAFKTGTPPVGANWPRLVPFNTDRWNNADYPRIDWSPAGRGKPYVDPTTGIRLRVVNHPGDIGWRAGPGPLETWSGGTGWTNPANALSGSVSSVATTSGTNPLDLYAAAIPLNDWYRSMDNLGLVIYGSGTEGSGGVADRQVDICLVFDPAQGCAGEPFRVTLPTGGVTRVDGSVDDSDRVWPQGFPYAAYYGWGGAAITSDRLATQGSLNASAGALTLNPSGASFFPNLSPGQRIKIAGSGCPGDFCMVSSVTNSGSVSVAEPVTGTNMAFTAYPWSFRVRKVTSSGSISIGFKHKVSGSAKSSQFPGGAACHPIGVVSADGISGHACAITGNSNSSRILYFISDDGSVIRYVGIFRIPHSKLGSMPAVDRPSSGADHPQFGGFSATDGRVFFVSTSTNDGSLCIYRVAYTGDWVQEVNYPLYGGGYGGDIPETDEHMTWANVTPPSQNKDIGRLVKEAYPDYNETIYGSFKNSSLAGISGNRAFFYQLYSGQDGGPCWIATLDLERKSVISLIHTLDGTGLSDAQWGACHSVYPSEWPLNTAGISMNALNANNAGKLHGGPFIFKPSAIRRGGNWSSDTSLQWPVNNSWDNACPADIPQKYKDFGATGDQCVTLRFPGHPCNTTPGAAEKANFPACNWNPNYTQPAPLTVGSVFYDPSLPGGGDSERFQVVKITNLPGGELEVVAQRNASWDYCCRSGPSRPGANCVSSEGQVTHANGWTARMQPGGKNACSNATISATFEGDGLSNTFEPLHSYGRSHSVVGRNGDNINFVSGGLAKFNIAPQELSVPPLNGWPLSSPSFNGITAPIGTIVQQYLSQSQSASVRPTDVEWVVDANAYNPSSGFFTGLGARALTQVNGNIWKIGVIGGVKYKTLPLMGWVGSRILQDVSGPQSDLSGASDYTFCHALRAGECMPGSAAGETFVKAPRIYPAPDCNAGVLWNSPCIITAQPGVGGVRQQLISAPDPTGMRGRFLTYGLSAPGLVGAYYGANVHPSGKSILIPAGLEGLRSVTLVAQLPELRIDSGIRNTFGGLTVRLPERPGAATGRVRFGYDTALRCTARDEACVTNTGGDGFVFVADASSPAACSAGCEIAVPGLSGRLLYYQAEWLDSSGNVVETGEKSAVVIP